MNEQAIRITDTVTRLQKELRCGICFSTFNDPILSTCFHAFCRKCIEECFAKKRKLQCPICRQVLDKRSCKDSYQLTQAVQNYLKLSEAFKKDIGQQQIFKTIPPELAFCESQVPLDITIIPENDGKRVAPEFLMPLLPARRKRPSKPQPVPNDVPTTSNARIPTPEKIVPVEMPSVSKISADTPKKSIKVDRYAQTVEEAPKPFDTRSLNIESLVKEHRKENNAIDVDDRDIEALFELIPSIEGFLKKRKSSVARKLGLKEGVPEVVKEEKSVKVPEGSEGPEKAENRKGEEEEDEVISNSEDEEEINVTKVSEISQKSRKSDANSTLKCIQNESALISNELERQPIVITCSRLSNEKDEELLADFYSKFLSNACRFTEEVTEHTTHLVMMNSENRHIPQKSLAYVYAVARKCYVVGRDWLKECIETGTILNEADFTIQTCPASIADLDFGGGGGGIAGESGEIGWERARRLKEERLFDGIQFMILRRFTASKVLDYKKLIDLVQISGGQIFNSMDQQHPEKLFIIFSEYSASLGEAINMERIYKCPVVTCDWVMDSISEYKMLPIDKYLAKNVPL